MSPSPPYNSLIHRTRQVDPPSTWDDLANPPATYPTIIVVGGAAAIATPNPTAINGTLIGITIGGGDTCRTPPITTYSY